MALSTLKVKVDGDAYGLMSTFQKAEARFDKFKKGMNSSIGSQSMLKDSMEILAGGGAVIGVTMVGKALGDATSKAIELRNAFLDGKKSAGELGEELMGTLPVIGEFWKFGRGIRELYTQEEYQLRKQKEHYEAMVTSSEKMLATRRALKDLTESTKQTNQDIEQRNTIKQMKLNGSGELAINLKQNGFDAASAKRNMAGDIANQRAGLEKNHDLAGAWKVEEEAKKAFQDGKQRVLREMIQGGELTNDDIQILQGKSGTQGQRDGIQKRVQARIDQELVAESAQLDAALEGVYAALKNDASIKALKELETQVATKGEIDVTKYEALKKSLQNDYAARGGKAQIDFSAADEFVKKAGLIDQGRKLDNKLAAKAFLDQGKTDVSSITPLGFGKNLLTSGLQLGNNVMKDLQTRAEGYNADQIKRDQDKKEKEKQRLRDAGLETIQDMKDRRERDSLSKGLGDPDAALAYNKEIRKLNEQVSSGAIDIDTYNTAVKQANDDLQNAQVTAMGAPESLAAGSLEAARLMVQMQRQQTAADNIPKDQLTATLSQTEVLKQVAENTKKGTAVTMAKF